VGIGGYRRGVGGDRWVSVGIGFVCKKSVWGSRLVICYPPVKQLAFSSVYFFETSLINGLRAIQNKVFRASAGPM